MTTVFIKLLEDWVTEAVSHHGDDWAAIRAFVEDKLESLGEDQRAEFSHHLALLLQSNDKKLGPVPH